MFLASFAALIALALVAAIVLWRQAYELCVRAPADAKLVLRALRDARDDPDRLDAMARALEPVWVAALVHAAHEAASSELSADAAIDEAFVDLEPRADRRLLLLATLGRAAQPSAFVLAIVELSAAFRHDAGLLSLQKGLAESVAISHATALIVTGITTSVVCRFGVVFLRRRAKRLFYDLRACAEALGAQARTR